MIILGIETSCDETALCILETHKDSYRILGNIVHSQVNLHSEYGGVVPMLAKREHIKNLPILYEKIVSEAGISESKLDRIAVTHGPGLEPALWTGILFAKELGKKLDIPVIPINHMEGHIVSSLLEPMKDLELPALAVLISGGHTEIVQIEELGKYKILGRTVDDAVGEAFDKTARMLGLAYPGGPQISKLAEQARLEQVVSQIKLPRPMLHSKDLNFSFSGLKTAVLYALREIGTPTNEQVLGLAREFEDAVTEVLISKTRTALEENDCKTLLVGGGVIANKHIREAFVLLAKEKSITLHTPSTSLTGDNALMIAFAGSMKKTKPSEEGFVAVGNLSLEN